MHYITLTHLALGLCLAAACGAEPSRSVMLDGGEALAAGSGSLAAGSGSLGSSAAAPAAAPKATFGAVYAVFANRCAGPTCHVATTISAGGGLSMKDRASAYRALVGASSTACWGEKRVVARSPAKSELVHTLERTPLGNCTRTPRMPEAMAKLPQSEIDTVVAWINAGAPND